MIPDVYDVLLGLSEGRYTLEQAIGWIELHINDQKDEQQYQEQQRRREMFEKVALMFERVALTNFNGDVPDITIIRKIADKILSDADKFARGE